MRSPRLFDCIAYQLEKFPKPDMLAAKENGYGENTAQRKYEKPLISLRPDYYPGVSGNE